MGNTLIRENIRPVRIVEQSSNVKNAETLFENCSDQIFFREDSCLEVHGEGYLILDFGQELQGGIRLLANYVEGQKFAAYIRIRFGESVGETCAELGEKNAGNYHSIRDMTVELPDMSDLEWGQTGFRFVRIDFLTPNKTYRLVNIYAVYVHRDLQYRGSFECSDKRINEIYNTACRTLFLNMQGQLWDGIKRDRLVWIGDMQPEVSGITYLFGEDECVERAVQLSVEKNPLPCWFGRIATYSFWLIQVLYEYCERTGKKEFARKHLEYIEGILRQLDECVSLDGVIDLTRSKAESRGFFLDWSTFQTENAEAGNRFVFIYTLNNLKKLYKILNVGENPLVESLLLRLKKVEESGLTAKQVIALGYLTQQLDVETTREQLLAGGGNGLSTHMSYFILKALADCADITQALNIMKEYFGGMLDRGATTFWESFNLEWLENSGRIDERTPTGLKDLHGDFGEFCYVGFRHSLCHGWSCGPIPFLVEEVLGVEVLDECCRKIRLRPKLGYLQWVKGKFPTPYGDVEISHSLVDGKIKTEFLAPLGVSVCLD